jgi:hypothetical protein
VVEHAAGGRAGCDAVVDTVDLNRSHFAQGLLHNGVSGSLHIIVYFHHFQALDVGYYQILILRSMI